MAHEPVGVLFRDFPCGRAWRVTFELTVTRAYVCSALLPWRYSRVRHLEEKGGGAMRQFLVWLALCASSGISWAAPDFRARPPEDEIVYFVLPDRFETADISNDTSGLTGDRLTTGFDPTHKGFYHGGDLKGLDRAPGLHPGPGSHGHLAGPYI
jgi:hypothetical protein